MCNMAQKSSYCTSILSAVYSLLKNLFQNLFIMNQTRHALLKSSLFLSLFMEKLKIQTSWFEERCTRSTQEKLVNALKFWLNFKWKGHRINAEWPTVETVCCAISCATSCSLCDPWVNVPYLKFCWVRYSLDLPISLTHQPIRIDSLLLHGMDAKPWCTVQNCENVFNDVHTVLYTYTPTFNDVLPGQAFLCLSSANLKTKTFWIIWPSDPVSWTY